MNSFYGQTNMKNRSKYLFGPLEKLLDNPDIVRRTLVHVDEAKTIFKGKLCKEKEFMKSDQVGAFTLSASRFYMHFMNFNVGLFDRNAFDLEDKVYYTRSMNRCVIRTTLAPLT